MEALEIESTKKTPEAKLRDGLISLKGVSIPENPKKIYSPILKWLKDYAVSPAIITVIDLDFEYLDTASSKWIINILKEIYPIFKSNNEVVVNWYFEVGDDDMYDLGEYIQSNLGIPFTFIEKKENISTSL
ncbi:MAG: DUF1987 domain-containing protein [Bacteroidota bacterium]|nr:DUF1987 domain-containing protein [Bacteroidota bacterium]MDP4225951.1 DUF1987 domain-containing protein [Bacteroidota bacterium]MDP4274233.1 DUF1987 domain-containing protein [Bacteroidota bacterium]